MESQENSSVHFQNLSAYLHRQKTTFAIKFSKWESVSISLIGAKLIIYQVGTKDKEMGKNDMGLTFNLTDFDIKMSKKISQFQKKNSFGLIMGQQKIIFGFDSEKIAQKVYQKLKQASKKKQKTIQNASKSKVSENKIQKTQANHQSSDISEAQDQSFQSIVNSEWFCDDGNSQFINHKNFQSGRLLVHKSNKNIIKASFLVQNFKCQSKDEAKFKVLCLIVDSYLNATMWNMQVEQINKICPVNAKSFLICTKIKKQGLVSYARQAVQLVILEKDESSHQINLYITSEVQFTKSWQNPNYFKIDNQQIQEKISKIANPKNVKMDVKQKVRIGIEGLDTFAILLLEIKSQMKFNGYNSAQDDAAMNAKYFQSFDRLNEMVQNLLKSQLSSQAQINDKKMVFLQDYYKACLPSLKNKTKQEKPTRQIKKDLTEIQKQAKTDQPQNIAELSRQQKYIRALRKSYRFPFSLKQAEQLINLTKSKSHQNYYLKHRFEEQSLTNEQHRHSIKQPNHFVFNNGDWRFDQNRQLYFDNQEIIQANNNVGKFLLKQFGSNLLKGQNIMNMSLPVDIFDDKSLLQRIAVSFGHVANYLTQAALIQDPLQQFKIVTNFMLCDPLLHIKNTKPFNPILGQTFQCRLGGIYVFLQQISHHPAITAYLVKTQTMQIYGQAQTFVEFGFNCIHARNHSFLRINFPKTKTQYKGGESEIQLGGLMFGLKYQRYNGFAFLHQKNNNLYSEWSFGKTKKNIYPKQPKQKMKRNDINGGIFKVTKDLGQKLWNQKNKLNWQGLKSQQIQKPLVWIHGCWTGDIYFDNKKIKQFQNPIPFKVQRLDYVLPSDCNLRADVIYKRCGNNRKSQQAKQQLQNIQRRDRKLREAVKKVK